MNATTVDRPIIDIVNSIEKLLDDKKLTGQLARDLHKLCVTAWQEDRLASPKETIEALATLLIHRPMALSEVKKLPDIIEYWLDLAYGVTPTLMVRYDRNDAKTERVRLWTVDELKAIWAEVEGKEASVRIGEEHLGPIDMILPCPNCGMLHVDAPEPDMCECGHLRSAHMQCSIATCEACPHCSEFKIAWTNPSHKSHLCSGCKTVWRPADVPTNGIAEIKTRGEKDSWPVVGIPKCSECEANASINSGGIWRCDFHHDRQSGKPEIWA